MPQRENFICYASWLDIIEAYENSDTPEMAGELAKEIIRYGVTGEIKSQNSILVGTINAMCKDLVEKSKKRYQSCVNNGRQGGRPKKYSEDEIIRLHESGLSDQDIADNLGCSIRTVQRALEIEMIIYDELS